MRAAPAARAAWACTRPARTCPPSRTAEPDFAGSRRVFRISSLSGGPWCGRVLEFAHRTRHPPENLVNALAILVTVAFFIPITLTVALQVATLRPV